MLCSCFCSQIDIAPGHVSALFDTSMITREDNLPKLLKGSFLAIDDIVLENQRCADIQPLGMISTVYIAPPIQYRGVYRFHHVCLSTH